MATQLDRIERILAALCDHLGVHDASALHTQTPEDLSAENGHRYVGVVSRFEHGWGFVHCGELNRNFFVHYRDVEGTGLRLLEVGEEVTFEVGPGKDGRPKAVRVRRQRIAPALPGQPQGEAASNRETARESPSPTDATDGGDEEDDMPQPETSQVLPSRSTRRTTIKRARLGVSPGGRPPISW